MAMAMAMAMAMISGVCEVRCSKGEIESSQGLVEVVLTLNSRGRSCQARPFDGFELQTIVSRSKVTVLVPCERISRQPWIQYFSHSPMNSFPPSSQRDLCIQVCSVSRPTSVPPPENVLR